MTRRGSSSAVFQALEAGLKMFRWVVLGLLVMFCASGVATIEPSEIGLLLRFGKLHGSGAGNQIKPPGLLLALPRPIDRLIRVPVKREGEVTIVEVAAPKQETIPTDSIDVLQEGYCLTGDLNVVQSEVTVKYKISDPIAFQLRTGSGAPPAGKLSEQEEILRDVVLAALTQTLAQWNVDDALRVRQQGNGEQIEGQSLSKLVWQRAQQRLDRIDVGMQISALEVNETIPPRHVIAEFRDVQSARIEMDTKMREAEGFAAREIPQAKADRNQLEQQAATHEATIVGQASAELATFAEIHEEYRKNPEIMQQRLYIEMIQQLLTGVGKLDFVSPETRVILPSRTRTEP